MPELCRTSVEEYREMEKLPVCLVADNVRSRHNVGAFFRTADAFRIHSIYLCGISPLPPDTDIHKTALGAEKAVQWQHFPSTMKAIDYLLEEGWTIVALEQTHNSVELDSFHPAPDEKIALIAGNEVEGVSEEVLRRCHYMVEIPQQGTKHSLNVSVSAGIALYTLFLRQKG